MSQFQVPQFIETESKIVGPMTLKQFLYVAAAGLLSFFMFFILKTFAWIVITALIALVAISLAFVKYNGRPLTTILASAVGYLWKPKLYLWQRKEAEVVLPKMPEAKMPGGGPVSKVKSLWLSLITKKPPVQPK